jgi:hypothetical protein
MQGHMNIKLDISVLKEPAASIFRTEVARFLANHARSHPIIPSTKEHFHIV